MKKTLSIFVGVIFIFFLMSLVQEEVSAQVCWSTRVINEHSCSGCTEIRRCSDDLSRSCVNDSDCSAYGAYRCLTICAETYSTTQSCRVLDKTVSCSSAPSCS